MKSIRAATLAICGLALISCSAGRNVHGTSIDGAGYFVNITDVVPDVILEIRYYSTYTRIRHACSSLWMCTYMT